MRHNAEILISHKRRTKLEQFYISLPAFGSPPEVKELLRRAMRGVRRELTHDAETFIVRIIRNARSEVNIFPENAARHHLYTYHIILSDLLPEIRIKKEGVNIIKPRGLFGWIGGEKIAPKVSKSIRDPIKQRRGRPSFMRTDPRLRGLMQPAPDKVEVDPVSGKVTVYRDGKPLPT